jgi:hypothetical protein
MELNCDNKNFSPNIKYTQDIFATKSNAKASSRQAQHPCTNVHPFTKKEATDFSWTELHQYVATSQNHSFIMNNSNRTSDFRRDAKLATEVRTSNSIRTPDFKGMQNLSQKFEQKQ